MKSIIKKTLAGTLTAAMLFSPLTYAKDGGTYGFQNFKKQQDYTEKTFSDITADWIHQAVKPGYELGLMSGQGKNLFQPNANVTLAEVIAIAVRIHDLYTGGEGSIPPAGSSWYDGSVLYAVDHNIIEPGDYVNFQKQATRAQMATIFAHALPKDGYPAINSIQALPDVIETTPGHDSILTLYQAGILSGNDDYGSFHPATTTTRSEVAVIVGRIADPSLRKTIVLRPLVVKTATHTTYTAKSKRFTLTVPKPWKEAGIYSSAYNSLELFGPKDLQRIAVIEADKQVQTTPMQFINSFIDDIKKSVVNPTVTPYETVTIHGQPALSCKVTGTLSDVPLVFHFVLVESQDRYYILNGCTPQETDTQFTTSFQAMINTFTLIK